MSDIIIGAIIALGGSAIALFGTWLNNQHQRAMAKDNREHENKYQVFMEGMEHLSRARLLIPKIPSLTEEEAKEFANESAAFAKMAVIASNDTLQAVNAYSSGIAETFFELLPDRFPIDEAKAETDIYITMIADSEEKRDLALAQMSAFNLEGRDDGRLWNQIEKNYDMYHREVLETRQSLRDRQQKMYQLTVSLSLKCVEAVKGMAELEIAAVAAVRKDLGMDFNEDDYRATVTATNTSVVNSAKKFYGQLHADRN